MNRSHSDTRPTQQPTRHFVSGRAIVPPFPDGTQQILFGMGCFWGAERRLWGTPGVLVTAVGYAGGATPRPSYEDVCSGQTGHAEVVLTVFEPDRLTLDQLLAVFWESHDPTQGMRQGNDVGTQYRSAVYVDTAEDLAIVVASRERYQAALHAAGIDRAITTEVGIGKPFYYAEDYHQQYLAKNPHGYCGLGGTGVCLSDAAKTN